MFNSSSNFFLRVLRALRGKNIIQMDTYIKKTKIKASVERVFSWHERDGVIARLTPPWAPLEMISRSGQWVEKGVRVKFRIKFFGISMVWLAEHFDYEKNVVFKDRQLKGPFSVWEHTHRFIPDGESVYEPNMFMEDRVRFKLPFGLLSLPFYGLAKKEFDRMFSYRHRVLKHDLEHDLVKGSKKRILISGASGTIGKALVPFLRTCGHEVIRLVRKKDKLKKDEIFWDPYSATLDLDQAGPLDAVINLNGMDISRGKWSDVQKQKIIDSRVIPTSLLVEKMKGLKHKPKVFICASAIGFYGEGGDSSLSESSSCGDFFISDVCRQWEDAALAAESAGIRTVRLRIGIVLSLAGGALARMALPFQLGCGVIISEGRQYMSWISMDDAVSAILHILNSKEISGAVNLTAPVPVTNKEFSLSLARVFSKKVRFRLSKSIALLLWGQMGKETLLSGARVKPDKLLNSGFSFQHEDVFAALKDMLGR